MAERPPALCLTRPGLSRPSSESFARLWGWASSATSVQSRPFACGAYMRALAASASTIQVRASTVGSRPEGFGLRVATIGGRRNPGGLRPTRARPRGLTGTPDDRSSHRRESSVPGSDRAAGEGERREAAEERGVSRGHVRDLVALLALPALWKDKDQEWIASDLLDVLVSHLRLDCAFVRLTEAGAGRPLEHAWPDSCEITREVAGQLQPTPGAEAAPLGTLAAPAPGGGRLRLARVEQRFPGEECVVVVGARRASFPTRAEGFLLQVAADQAAIAVHGARLLAREQAAREEAELRAAQMSLAAEVGAAVAGAAELDGMLRSCADAMARNLEAPCAGIWLAEGQVLVLRARGGQCGFSPRHERVPMGAHRVGLIAQERRPHLINQLQYDPLGTDAGWAGRNRLTAFAGYPLVVEDRLIGVLGVYAARPLREQ